MSHCWGRAARPNTRMRLVCALQGVSAGFGCRSRLLVVIWGVDCRGRQPSWPSLARSRTNQQEQAMPSPWAAHRQAQRLQDRSMHTVLQAGLPEHQRPTPRMKQHEDACRPSTRRSQRQSCEQAAHGRHLLATHDGQGHERASLRRRTTDRLRTQTSGVRAHFREQRKTSWSERALHGYARYSATLRAMLAVGQLSSKTSGDPMSEQENLLLVEVAANVGAPCAPEFGHREPA